MGRLLVRRFEQQGGRCAYCRRVCKLRAAQRDDLQATIDHVIPKSGGGADAWWNKVMACRACNQAKGASDPGYYMRVLEQHGFMPPGAKSKMQARVRRLARRERRRSLDGLPAGSRKERLPAPEWHLNGMAAGE